MRAILLCAGASSRLGEPKALVRIGGARVIDRLLDGARPIDAAGRPQVVTGCHDAEIRAVLGDDPPAQVVTCARWREGRTASLQAGIAALGGHTDVMVVPADVPLVRAGTFLRLRDAWEDAGAPSGGWMNPTFEDGEGRTRRGHPVIVGRDLVARILRDLDADASLRDAMAAASPLLTAPVDDAAILDDLDTPGDLRALRER